METRGKQSAVELAYLAGLVDSDGWIGANRAAPRGPKSGVSLQYTGIINVTNTDIKMMDWIVERFGGKVYTRKNHGKNWRDTYDWRLQSQKAADCCRLIRDYLVIKQHKADLLIEFVENRPPHNGRKRLPEGEMQRRHDIWLRFKQMNSTGLVQPERLNLETPNFYIR